MLSRPMSLFPDSRAELGERGRINDVDGDTHCRIYKCKVTDTLEGEFADGGFFITKCSGEALGDADDQPLEQRRGAFDQIQMPIGDRIESAGINDGDAQSCSPRVYE